MVMYSHILLTYRGNVYHGEVSPPQQPIKPTVSDILHQKLQHIDEYFINLNVLVKSKLIVLYNITKNKSKKNI